MDKVLIIPPAGPGSLGDAAMIAGAVTHRLAGPPGKGIHIFSDGDWGEDVAPARTIGGQRLLHLPCRHRSWWLRPWAGRYSCIWLIGGDILDGAYGAPAVLRRLEVLAAGSRRPGARRIVSASFNTHPDPDCLQALRDLPHDILIFARDPFSRDRLEYGLGRSVRLGADLAFLLRPAPLDAVVEAAGAWIDAQRATGRRPIAINANPLHVKGRPGLTAALARLMHRLIEAGFSLLLVPHDTRGGLPDERLLLEAAGLLDAPCRTFIRLFPPGPPSAVKAVLARVDLLVTGRMHAAILAMGSGTPAFSFGYQDKFEGLLAHFDLSADELISDPDALVGDPEGIAGRIEALAWEAQGLRPAILRGLPKVAALAKGSLDAL